MPSITCCVTTSDGPGFDNHKESAFGIGAAAAIARQGKGNE
ncbi:hypothetical protein HHX47_DHR5000319 [Lentinula edodes]|nr:hypothetical protein HHX47_DHR5000319 [Lentinula edodes]